MQSIARIPFFQDIQELDLDKYGHRCTWRRYNQNEIVVDFEDQSDDVFFILSGEVRVQIRTAAGKEIILADLRAGQFFGEYAAIDHIKRSANVTALSRSELCIMPAAVFMEILFASPAACGRILRLLTGRVRELNARLTEHSVFDLKHRLYAELLRLSQPRHGHAGERVITPPPFHHVLSARIGCRREQVTRELTLLSTEKLIAKTRGALVILRPEVLEARLAHALSEDA
ncbi:Crp/Fnr family transcriptional regulator [Methylovirgula sp. 4M-Z18]|uniref:Crp/Fnr family transcriptional regulator n=1 Tax=Methylovirgula sp. 4M-Z18 TaxID=2293567 RepID=UPI000E2F75CB|nr:Crp/Fnr family transcriptional regulator [Methylovirgula sp. 4M-Z18]RFB80595.1 Crp/Fnr family transcriptional regulator [Methylovirgula sp. 4M-Z18]